MPSPTKKEDMSGFKENYAKWLAKKFAKDQKANPVDQSDTKHLYPLNINRFFKDGAAMPQLNQQDKASGFTQAASAKVRNSTWTKPNTGVGTPPAVIDVLKEHEGERKKNGEHISYLDNRKKLTGGIGHLLSPTEIAKYPEGTPIPQKQVDMWFEEDSKEAYAAAQKQAKILGIDDSEFIPYLTSVNFQLGTNWNKDIRGEDGKIIKKGHTETWRLLKEKKYDEAAVEAANSTWNSQTPERVKYFQDAILALRKQGTQEI